MDTRYFLPLSDEQRRVLQDALQLHEATTQAKKALAQFRGSLSWKTVKSGDYLYRATRPGAWTFVGARSPDTEAIFERFATGREQAKQRLNGLHERLRLQAKYVAANRLGRMPRAAVNAVMNLGDAGFAFRVVGTHAMYAYEPMAGVQFHREITATEDIDVMFDGRRRLCLITSEPTSPSLLTALRRSDPSYELVLPYRAVNASGFMVDIIAPAWDPMRVNANLNTAPDDLTPAEIEGLVWLANAPSLSATAFALSGEPVTVEVPDPRFFAIHKLFVASSPTRTPLKAARDRSQALAVANVVQENLPWLSFGDPSLAVFPASMRQLAEDAFGIPIGPATSHSAPSPG